MRITRILHTSTTLAPKSRILAHTSRAAMSTLTRPVPIVLIGIHAEIGGPVAEGLRPDWDVIRQIQSFEAARSDLPHLLQGRAPPNPATNTVGSGAYGQPARAVLFGRGFSQPQAEALYAEFGGEGTSATTATTAAAEGTAEGDRVPVLWVASDDARRPVGREPPPGAEKIVVPIFKSALERWAAAGAEKGELVLY